MKGIQGLVRRWSLNKNNRESEYYLHRRGKKGCFAGRGFGIGRSRWVLLLQQKGRQVKGMGNAQGGNNDSAGGEKNDAVAGAVDHDAYEKLCAEYDKRKQRQHRFMPKKLSACTRTGNYS